MYCITKEISDLSFSANSVFFTEKDEDGNEGGNEDGNEGGDENEDEGEEEVSILRFLGGPGD